MHSLLRNEGHTQGYPPIAQLLSCGVNEAADVSTCMVISHETCLTEVWRPDRALKSGAQCLPWPAAWHEQAVSEQGRSLRSSGDLIKAALCTGVSAAAFSLLT